MTDCFITIDTEYEFSFTRRYGPSSRAENFARSIRCVGLDGEGGIGFQMDVLERYGLKAVFFVDPMPALVWGTAAIEDVVGPIVARGHDVQLHIHTEWLDLAGAAKLAGGRTGDTISRFPLEEQARLLEYARGVLIAAGAQPPVAFRAGNYGANDDTLTALASLGIRYDTSHCPGISPPPSAISLTTSDLEPIEHCGLVEVPIGCIGAWGGGLRHAQLTAISAQEILAAVVHARSTGLRTFTLVSHSFELMSRDLSRVNPIVRRRFEQVCAGLAALSDVRTGTFAENPPLPNPVRPPIPVLRHSPARTGWRLAEQLASNVLYGWR